MPDQPQRRNEWRILSWRELAEWEQPELPPVLEQPAPEQPVYESPAEPPADPPLSEIAVFVADKTSTYLKPAALFAISPGLPDRYNRESSDYVLLLRDGPRSSATRDRQYYTWRWFQADQNGCTTSSRTLRNTNDFENRTAVQIVEDSGIRVITEPDEVSQALRTIAEQKEAAKRL